MPALAATPRAAVRPPAVRALTGLLATTAVVTAAADLLNWGYAREQGFGLAYSPLMLVPCLVAVGTIIDGRVAAVPAVVLWFAAGIAASYAVLFSTFFALRGRRWARGLLLVVTMLVLLVDLPLCWLLLGADGLFRDGGPLVAAAGVALYGLWRAERTDPSDPASHPTAAPSRG